jgi:hypothetical protein
MCKRLDLRFQSVSREIATRHSSQGGEFGERNRSVKDAIFTYAGGAGASILDRIEATSPILFAVR